MTLEHVLTDPAALKAQFKRVQEGRAEVPRNWAIRLHRSISWYAKAMAVAGSPETAKEMAEARLLFLWIALSALFSRWDPEEHRPAQEGGAMVDFIDLLTKMDDGRVIIDCLGRRKATIRRLIANPALHAEFWVNPFNAALPEKLSRADIYYSKPLDTRAANALLRDTLYRIYMLRSQIVHGSSTSGSKYNRQTLSDSIQLLQALLPAAISVAITNGVNAEWPPLCYPPVDMQNPAHLLDIGRTTRTRA